MPSFLAAWSALSHPCALLKERRAALSPSLALRLPRPASFSARACDRHDRAPSSPVPCCFPPLSPPRSSRATPSASPPSPARRARARRPKPCWVHRSRRPPSPPTAGAHGRATSGRLPAIRDHQRARAGPLVLSHHSPAATGPSPAATGRFPGLLCSQLRPGASGSNLIKGRGLTTKTVTQMNSADKDLFAVNLLNLWKFIVIHRKFVK